MNGVEGANLLLERLDAYGDGFSIQFIPYGGGLRMNSDREVSIEVTRIRLLLSFDRGEHRMMLSWEATSVDRLVEDAIFAIEEGLKPLSPAA